jgi:hypothetical protein
LNGRGSHRCSAAPVPAAAGSELTAATTASWTTHRNLSLPKAVAPASRPDEISALGAAPELMGAAPELDEIHAKEPDLDDMRMLIKWQPARGLGTEICLRNSDHYYAKS